MLKKNRTISFLFMMTVNGLLFLACGGGGGTGNPPAETAPVNQDPEAGIPNDGQDDPLSYVYIRAGASGTGADWQSALPEFPAQLVRGKIYWVAGGAYPAPDFRSIGQGTTWVQIRHATAQSHGSDTGWQASYGFTQTIFPPLVVSSGYVMIDGRVTQGIKVLGHYQGNAVNIDANKVVLKLIDIDGGFLADANGYHRQGACTGLQINKDDNYVLNCLIHNIADDGVSITRASRLLFKNNRIYDLFGSGTDTGSIWCGPCYNGHSDGMEVTIARDSIFDGNYVVMTDKGGSTAALFLMDTATSPDGYCRNLLFRNNVFYTARSFAAYFFYTEGLTFVNNTVWGKHEGGPWGGGIAVCDGVTQLDLTNNIALFVRTTYGAPGFDGTKYSGNHNFFGMAFSGEWPLRAGDQVGADPGFMSAPGYTSFDPTVPMNAFALRSDSLAVDHGIPLPLVTKDAAGLSRPQGKSFDIGAFESH